MANSWASSRTRHEADVSGDLKAGKNQKQEQSHGARPQETPPIHPGEILNEEFLSPMKITQYRLAREIAVDARRIHDIVHGQRSITAETTLLFSRFFGNSAEFWMGLRSQYDLEREQDRLADRPDQVREHRVEVPA